MLRDIVILIVGTGWNLCRSSSEPTRHAAFRRRKTCTGHHASKSSGTSEVK